MKVGPRQAVEQLIAMKKLNVQQVVAMASATQVDQRHERHVAHLMLHQSHVELVRLLALVGLNTEHIVGAAMLNDGQQRLQLGADIRAQRAGLFGNLPTGIPLGE